MFERFTDRARRSLVLAQEHSRLLDHRHLGPEHVLLGLLDAGGIAADVMGAAGVDSGRAGAVVAACSTPPGMPTLEQIDALRELGIDYEDVRARVEATFGDGALGRSHRRRRRSTAAPAFTPTAKDVLERAHREALDLGDSYIGTEHLLLALLHSPGDVVRRVLADLDLDVPALRAATIDARVEALSRRRR